jgi:N-methylhydantoinase B/oxoprolinase/acetone carboxylase alpha subunit/N-methylhydantoinase A/oxoprolinase/acetone carboxylase beta subunit
MLLGVDVGGTYTDAVLVTAGADGHGATVHSAKVPTTPDQSDGVIDAAKLVMAAAGARPADITRFAHGMTVATNALLQGDGARTALIATAGHTDVVELGRQARASLYRLCEAGPPPWAPPELRYGAPERMGPNGPTRPLQKEHARALVEQIAEAQPEAVAVVLLHSYAHPKHEIEIGRRLAERLPDTHVSLSHELVGTYREYERAATTETDAALGPRVSGYLRNLSSKARAIGMVEPEVMQSSGGTIEGARAAKHAALTVLSGPAGGAQGALMLARAAGTPNVLCADMGGTSFDVCAIVNGAVVETAERKVDGRPIALAALDIHTVGAGGGSIAWRDAGGALRVGPGSAGATPGPACYGQGGAEPTVTDANLLLGRLAPETPLAGGMKLDRAAAQGAMEKLAHELDLTTQKCAEGVVAVAEAEMARALRRVTVERGIDPRRFTLMPFGGAGPLHAAALAHELGITHVACPHAAGVLSALGLAGAPPRRDAARTVMSGSAKDVEDTREMLVRQVRAQLGEKNKEGGSRSAPTQGPRRKESETSSDAEGRSAPTQRPRRKESETGVHAHTERTRVRYEMRYKGQSFELGVEQAGEVCEREVDLKALRSAFEDSHEERYGYRDERAEVEIVTIRVSAWGVAPKLALGGAAASPPKRTQRSVVVDGRAVQGEWVTGELPNGTTLTGPAVYATDESTLYVPPGWRGEADALGTVHLKKAGQRPAGHGRPEGGRQISTRGRMPRGGPSDRGAESHGAPAGELDPIELQVITGALRATCEEMGAVLVRAAHSANIKERRDASAALFDADGQMTMQAEHIPVHLGAMPAAVQAILAEDHSDGRPWMLNDPYAGGTHLPDITVVTPVLHKGELIGYAANRAHHADVGGRVPGSMPADSHTLAEEGVVITPRPMTAEAIEEAIAQMRQPDERRADLRAQLAANRIGTQRLMELATHVGTTRLRDATDAVIDYTERRTRAGIRALPDGEYTAEDVLEATEGDLKLKLRATVQGERMVLDFAGSAEQHAGNLNCPLAVTRSACYFAARVLSDPDVPPTAGAYRPIEVRVPTGTLLNAQPNADGTAPAVAGGNVETSSRVADLVLSALGRAQGQGTMNNLTVGNEEFSYYETLGGGQGGCPDADGPSGVHVAMSNTLNTPVEALEREMPLIVNEYAIRRGSGGAGKHPGGNGVVREIQAMREMQYSLITERRRHAPRGAQGGEPGAKGRNLLISAVDNEPRELPGKAVGQLAPGERLRIETPGGGGWGKPTKPQNARLR